MTTYKRFTNLLLSASLLWLTATPEAPRAEDIDVFVGATGAANPNVLIILDNSSNWSAANQNWPTDTSPPDGVDCGNDCDKQGYYELKAIRTVLKALTEASGDVAVNLGLMLFNNSNASRDGGYVRFHVQEMTATNAGLFLDEIDSIIENFNTETAASSVQYSAVLFDAFKYFGGLTNPDNVASNATPSTNPTYDSVHVFGTEFWGSNNADGTKPDADAYHDATRYNPPDLTSCGNNHIIFIGNGFPAKDNTVPDMGQVLRYLENPDAPASSIDEFEVTTYTPVIDSCSVVMVDDDSDETTPDVPVDCGTALECQDALDDYADSIPPELRDETDPDYCPDLQNNCDQGRVYECVEEKKACGNKQYRVHECDVSSWTKHTEQPSANAAYRFADEFAEFLQRTDVSSVEEQQNIITHTINVFKDQPSSDQEALMRSMATYGGGNYYSARSASAIEKALKEILIEILSVNSTFASASLPVNATNRAYNENQVFIGMFRPDPDARPRWFGNLKRYKLAYFADTIGLADIDGNRVVNTSTGFVKDCATSWWSSDSDLYWQGYNVNSGHDCQPDAAHPDDQYSDAPDGPAVEKGAVAEVIRKGNNPEGDPTTGTDTNTTPTWAVNRSMLTQGSGNTPAAFSTTSSGLDADLVDFTKGHDVNNENGPADTDTTETRASLHGGVIHSRPLPVNYGSDNIVVYYGANDGTLRAVRASNGRELWSFVAPESYTKLARLKDNSPLVSYPDISVAEGEPSPEPMSYFFDGSLGIYQDSSNTNVWIFPTMRRGGRALYAFDVAAPEAPSLKWKLNETDVPNLGQTWSKPNVAFIEGHSTTTPVVVMGGGYDPCEDDDSTAPDCADPAGSALGDAIYVIDPNTNSSPPTVLRAFNTTRSVAADVSLVDVNSDGYVDYAYAADTGGNIWRVSFVDPTTYAPRDKDAWTIHRIAYTNGSGRKFLYGPALLPTSDGSTDYVYLAIGSGDREHPLITNYPYVSNVVNRFYVYLDDPSDSTNTQDLDSVSDTAMTNLTTTTGCNNPAGVLPESRATDEKGWFMDLNQFGQGEQTVTSALIVGGMITFSTNRPVTAATCQNALGEARGYWVNLLNASGAIGVDEACGGARSAAFVSGGLPPSPVFATVPVVKGSDTKIVNVVIGAIQKKGGGTDSPIEGQQIQPVIESKRHRIYWYSESED